MINRCENLIFAHAYGFRCDIYKDRVGVDTDSAALSGLVRNNSDHIVTGRLNVCRSAVEDIWTASGALTLACESYHANLPETDEQLRRRKFLSDGYLVVVVDESSKGRELGFLGILRGVSRVNRENQYPLLVTNQVLLSAQINWQPKIMGWLDLGNRRPNNVVK